MKREKIRYYRTFTDDFAFSANQDYALPANYQWMRTDGFSKLFSGFLYGIALLLSAPLCKILLGTKIIGRERLHDVRGGFFLYGNHTQPIGDVFLPALCTFPKRIYTVVSPANLGIPFIGKLLPFLGAIPTAQSLHDTPKLKEAIRQRAEQGYPIVIFPEAHVWQYYTEIRPFPDTSFLFPAKLEKPVFTMTVTYRKSKFRKTPKTEIFLDGPFWGEGKTAKEKSASLCRKVRHAMEARSQNSNVSYIEYRKHPNA